MAFIGNGTKQMEDYPVNGLSKDIQKLQADFLKTFFGYAKMLVIFLLIPN